MTSIAEYWLDVETTQYTMIGGTMFVPKYLIFNASSIKNAMKPRGKRPCNHLFSLVFS